MPQPPPLSICCLAYALASGGTSLRMLHTVSQGTACGTEPQQERGPLDKMIVSNIVWLKHVALIEGLMLKLELQYFGHLMWRADSFERTLMLGKIEARKRRGQQRIRWLDGITDPMARVWASSERCEGKGNLMCCSPRSSKELDTTEQLKNNKYVFLKKPTFSIKILID